jgi:alpha-galactosidase
MAAKIVLIGAGSANFGLGTLGDIFSSEVLRGSSIVLHDINPQSLKRVEDLARQHIREKQLPFTLLATTSRREALQQATFCVISIEIGRRFDLWEQDWRVPQQFGNRQVYGENGGPGGLFHSLRIIPPILDICGDIQAVCPDAHVFNYSNPMSRICLAIKRKYPKLKTIGLCHEIGALPGNLEGILGVPFADLATKSGGLNHFTILLEAIYKKTGKDAYPDIRTKAAAYFEKLPELTEMLYKKYPQPGKTPKLKHHPWADRGLVKEILQRFGYLAITVDSHFGEYIQWAHSVVDHQSILNFYQWYKPWCLEYPGEVRIEGSHGGERLIPIMEGILTDSRQEELAVNIPNAGLIENLPTDLVVEVPAIITKNGAQGIKLGAFPKGIAGLLLNQVAVHDLTVETVLKGSRELALQALLVDPMVADLPKAEQMLDVMLALQKDYLGYIK